MDKENVAYIHNGILLSKRNEIMALAGRWMELGAIMLSEINQSPKHKGQMFSLIVDGNSQ